MTRSRSRRLAVALAGVSLTGVVLAGCGDQTFGEDDDAGDDDTPSETSSGPSTTPPVSPPTTSASTTTAPTTPSMTISPTGEVDAAELAEDLETAVTVTDAYWSRHWRDFFRGRYTPPTVVGLYDGNDPGSSPTCYGETLPPGNAFYCPEGDYVAWDQTLIELGYEIGDAWPYLIVAHEWGHAIQARLEMGQVDRRLELQADCLAAAALYGAADDPEIGLQFEEGDEREIVDGLNLIADEVPWGMSGDHGDSFQRIDAFNQGRSGGVEACLPGMTRGN